MTLAGRDGRSAQCLVVALAALVKFGLLIRYGALQGDDSVMYLRIAHGLLTDHRIFSSVLYWRELAIPGFALRPYGYPALIALAQLAAGDFYGTVLAVLQILMSLYVGWRVFDLAALVAGDGPRRIAIATAASCFYFVGITLLWDQTILSDGLFAFLFNLVLLRLGEDLATGRVPTRLPALGIAWGLGVLVRDVGLYFTILPAALCLAAAPVGRVRSLAAFLLPVVMLVGAYEGWNAYRTGAPFISITDVVNYLRPDFEIAHTRLADPFADDSAISEIVRAQPGAYDFDYPQQFALLPVIHDRLGLTSPLALGRVERQHLLHTIVAHPLAYARYVAGNLDPRDFGAILFDPVASVNDYFQYGLPPYRRIVPGIGLRALRELAHAGDFDGILLAAVSLVTASLATLGWIATIIGVPWLVLRRRRRSGLDGPALLALAMLGSVLVVLVFFALVHVEARHLLPAIPAGLVAAAYVAASMPPLRRRASSSIIQE